MKYTKISQADEDAHAYAQVKYNNLSTECKKATYSCKPFLIMMYEKNFYRSRLEDAIDFLKLYENS